MAGRKISCFNELQRFEKRRPDTLDFRYTVVFVAVPMQQRNCYDVRAALRD